MSEAVYKESVSRPARAGFPPAVKVIVLYLGFLLLYGVYRCFPVFPLSIMAATNESNFQHYKSLFFLLLIIALVEFLVYRRAISNRAAFWNSRLLAAALSPWVIFLFWYIAPAMYGKFPNVSLEAIYANVITAVVLICVVVLERSFLQLEDTRTLRIVIWALVLLSVLLYMVFTFAHLPWADVFVEPQWR